MKQPFQLAEELIAALGMPEQVEVSEGRTLDPDAPNIYINHFRIIGGKPALGRNVIRNRKAYTKNLLQTLPTDALRKIHAAVCGPSS